MVATSPQIRLWDDNPSTLDLLGFDAVVEPIVAAVREHNVHPLTLSVQSPWGGGKSTILKLVEAEFEDDKSCFVVSTNPWAYDDHGDVKGTLISEILHGIQSQIPDPGLKAKVAEKAKELLGRISWSRAAMAIAKGALTFQVDPAQIAGIFEPKDPDGPESMAGFNDAYKELLALIPEVERVVVLVDDLDRCLPDAVTATLEAIKLFLSTEKMVFVLAADQDMVRDAISVSLDGARRGDVFAKRYLEKIVQLPIALPRLSAIDAEAYIGLLIAGRSMSVTELRALASHVRSRRNAHQTPLLDDFDGLPAEPTEDDLALAAQLAEGLSADRLSNPRQIKRFLNAFGVRESIARARGAAIPPGLMVKMLLLEELHRSSFNTLAAAPVQERKALLVRWQAWAKPTGEEGEDATLPDGIDEATKEWAAAPPSLTNENLDPYLTLAASLINVSMGAQVSDEVVALINDLLGESQAARNVAAGSLSERGEDEQLAALDVLFATTKRMEDAEAVVRGAVLWVSKTPALEQAAAVGVETHCWGGRLTPGAIVELANSGRAALVGLVRRAAQDTALHPSTQAAAHDELEQIDGN
ncbi:KAP family P-loop NTPase fold protein [Brachybacterium tyrofermentans]|uniref:KAP family P-loop NTPase fold protein n=1 Tax=Brachybacterium tyrofermentans TaxID=47848 RepID=UPI003FD0CF4F